MNIEKNQVDELVFTLKIDVAAADYAESERKKLNDYKRKSELKGFRKGTAPLSLIQRLYGTQVLYESVNAVVSKALDDYIHENDVKVVGEPLPSETQVEQEWKSGNDFSFTFDVATYTCDEFTLSTEDKLPYYNILVSDTEIAQTKENVLRQYGSLQEGEVASEEDYLIVDFDNGEHKAESVYVAIPSVTEDCKSKFVGAKPGDKFQVNVNEAFSNDTDRAAMLKIGKEQLPTLNPEFEVTVLNVKTFVSAEENQETYDKIYGEDQVHNGEEFNAKIAERLAYDHKQQADYKFSKDAREYLVNRSQLSLPEEFLKRWLVVVNEGKFTKEDIEKEFPSFIVDYRWDFVRGRLLEAYKLEVEQKDLNEAAQAYVSYQYAMYGMGNVPQYMIEQSAQEILKDERQRRHIFDMVEDNLVIDAVKKNITLDTKDITLDEFKAL